MNKRAAPKLQVIEGGKKALPEWLAFPPTVTAASPNNPDQAVVYRVAVGDAIKAARARRYQIAFNLWSIVFGEPPPVPNVEGYNSPAKKGLLCLTQAHACFKGIKRPLDTDNTGGTICAYVMEPRSHYAYQYNMACVAKKHKVQPGVVFVVYARLDEHNEDGVEPAGIITHWQFVDAVPVSMGDGRTEMLPIDFADRYDERLW